MPTIREIGRAEAATLTIPHLLELRASELGDRVAFQGVDGELTYSAWWAEAARMAEVLRAEAGVQLGDRVFLWFGNDSSVPYWTTYVAVGLLGATTVSLDDRLSMREVTGLMKEATPSSLVVSERLSRARGLTVEGNPAAGTCDAVVYGRLENGLHATGAPFTSDPSADGRSAHISIAARPDQISTISFTSGTTGRPKGVKQTRLVSYMERVANEVWAVPRGARVTHEDVIQSPIPVYTAWYNVLTALFTGGRAVIEGQRFDPVLSEQLMASAGSTIYNGAPAHFLMMADRDRPAPSPDRLSLLVSGGSGFSKAVHERMLDRWPSAAIVNWYGLNEGGNLINFGDDLREQPTAIGRPTAGVEVKVVRADGETAVAGESGELLISDGAFHGYYKRPDLDAEKYVDGWFHTGDVVTRDETGVLTLVGRNEDRINRGGFKFYPAEIENAALEHPEVAEAAAIGVPHATLGQDAVLFVVPKAGYTIAITEMRSFLGERIARNKVPSSVIVKSALPRNSYGKVLRSALSDEYGYSLGGWHQPPFAGAEKA